MSIFISYSHRDAEFVEKLALQLVQHNVHVWVDRWELGLGDSILSKIQQAITGASALLVVLSPASVASAWVEKELNAGLLRELEERRVVVMPVLLEDCKIPVFLRDKLYADFRSDFDAGLRTILEGVARISNAYMSRVDDPQYHADWAFDWGTVNGRAAFYLTIVEQAKDQPYTVVARVEIVADRQATLAYLAMEREDRAEEAHKRLMELVADSVNKPQDLVFVLGDQFEQVRKYSLEDTNGLYSVRVSARLLGIDTGRGVLYRAGQQLRLALEHMTDVTAGSQRPNTGQ